LSLEPSCEPTYEELKHIVCEYDFFSLRSCEPTYEELKQQDSI